MKKLMMSALLMSSLSAHAVSVTVTSTCGSLTPQQCADLDTEIQNAVNQDLPDANIDKYAEGIANANGFASSGLGSD